MTKISIRGNFTGIIYKLQCTESWPYHVVIINGTDGVVYSYIFNSIFYAEQVLEKQLNQLTSK